MKRALLIAGGTVGGLGAVMAVTPPQLNSSGIATLAGASASTLNTPTPSKSTAAAVTLPKATKEVESEEGFENNESDDSAALTTTSPSTPAPVVTKRATAKKSATKVTPTPSATTSASSAPTSNAVTGSFTGDAINVGYGIVQVKITVSNGKITDAQAVQAPYGRSQRFTDYAIPNLRTQTLAAQSSAIQGVSGASYTSYGWYKSLITALNKAGLPA